MLLISTPSAPSASAGAGASASASAFLPTAPALPAVHTIGAEFGVAADLFAPLALARKGGGGGGGAGGGGGGGGEGEEAEAEGEAIVEDDVEGAAEAAAAAEQPLCHSWFVAEVLEHRLKRGRAGAHEFRVRWVGLRPNDRRHKTWHPFSMFATYGADGTMPGELTCTLLDDKIGSFMEKHRIPL